MRTKTQSCVLLSEQQRNRQGNDTVFLVAEENRHRAPIDVKNRNKTRTSSSDIGPNSEFARTKLYKVHRYHLTSRQSSSVYYLA